MSKLKMNARRSLATLAAWMVVGALSAPTWAATETQETAKESAAKEAVRVQAQEKLEATRVATQQKLEAAQNRLEAAAREVADLSMSLSDHVMPMGKGTRAVLGINISSGLVGEDRENGVEILGVSPGGSAAEAGLKPGDVVVELDGNPLAGAAGGSPRKRLLQILGEVEPGEKVTVKYLRDGKSASTVVTARAAENRFFTLMDPPGQSVGGVAGRGTGPGPRFVFRRAMGVFGNAEFAPMTPKLGQYFGVDKGLLVVRAPSDTRLKLEEGDVVLDIDGRVPTSPSHALRILGSYQPGEKVKINAMRMKKRVSFDITIQEQDTPEDGPHETGQVFFDDIGPGEQPRTLRLPDQPVD